MPSLPHTPLTIDALLRVIVERDAEVALLKHMVNKLKLQVARRVREQYGRSSEQLDVQFTLIPTEALKAPEASAVQPPNTKPRKPRRDQRKLPEHLPRETRVHHPKGYAADAPCACSECGGKLRQIGEDVAEQLEYVPGRFKVSLLRTAHAVVPAMLKQGSGKIINVGAYSAQKGAAQMGAYIASKAVVARLTETMAAELRERGINVNAVLPTIIDTPENRAAMPNADPQRWVAPQDLANVIVFLASDAARAVHGATLPVTGLSRPPEDARLGADVALALRLGFR